MRGARGAHAEDEGAVRLPPARAEEPGPGPWRRPWRSRSGQEGSESARETEPAVEGRSRREAIEADGDREVRLAMLPSVREDVCECVPHLARSEQIAAVVAIPPDLAILAAEQLVEAHGEADDDAANERGEVVIVVGLEDHVNVIALDAVVDHLPRRASGLVEDAFEKLLDALVT